MHIYSYHTKPSKTHIVIVQIYYWTWTSLNQIADRLLKPYFNFWLVLECTSLEEAGNHHWDTIELYWGPIQDLLSNFKKKAPSQKFINYHFWSKFQHLQSIVSSFPHKFRLTGRKSHKILIVSDINIQYILEKHHKVNIAHRRAQLRNRPFSLQFPAEHDANLN